jgi:hypothetical protein
MPIAINIGVMALKMSHEQSLRWTEKYQYLLDGTDFETTKKSRVAVSLLHLSLEHQKAICALVGCGNVNASAFALLRPQFEAYVRGLWFNRCALDPEIEHFINGNDPPRINTQIEAIEKTPGYKHGALMRKKETLWKALNDFTHGGLLQVTARNTDSEIIGNYRQEQLVWLLNRSSSFALLAGIEIAKLANNIGLSNTLRGAYKEIYPSEP